MELVTRCPETQRKKEEDSINKCWLILSKTWLLWIQSNSIFSMVLIRWCISAWFCRLCFSAGSADRIKKIRTARFRLDLWIWKNCGYGLIKFEQFSTLTEGQSSLKPKSVLAYYHRRLQDFWCENLFDVAETYVKLCQFICFCLLAPSYISQLQWILVLCFSITTVRKRVILVCYGQNWFVGQLGWRDSRR